MTDVEAESRVYIHEVAPRDGFQIEPRWIETADKVGFVDALSRTGVSKIEVSSFVSPRAIPNLRDSKALFKAIKRCPGVVYTALVPNERGAERAIAAGADEVNFVLSVSETHNLANMRMTASQSLAALGRVVQACRAAGVGVHGTIATSFGCPFEGDIPLKRVLDFVDRYLDIGVVGVTLADTTGMANPRQVASTLKIFRACFGAMPLTLHFHNTRGMGLANVLTAFHQGFVRFDAALGGLGGCPFAPGATGNVCTEDVVHMFEEMRVDTGVDLLALLEVARTLPGLVGHEVPGQVVKAGRSRDLHTAATP